jgi:hypothetical protein
MMPSVNAVCASVLLAARLTTAQEFSFGIKAGLPVNAILSASEGAAATTFHYTIGPTAELGLSHRISVDVDLLYKRFALDFSIPPPAAMATPRLSRATGNRWEIPLFVKYSIARRTPRPFVELGFSFNHIAGIHGISVCAQTSSGQEFYCAGNQTLFELRHRSTKGVLIGAGLETRLGRLRIDPEFRLTHWADRNFGVRDAPLRSNLTEAELLVGFTF